MEVEILSYHNTGNRLASGECCSKSGVSSKEENAKSSSCSSECDAYCRICISEIPGERNSVMMMPELRTTLTPRKSKRRSSSRDRGKPSTSTVASVTQGKVISSTTMAPTRVKATPVASVNHVNDTTVGSKSSIFKFFSRIFGTVASFGNFIAASDLERSSSCTLASWTKNLTQLPISMKSKIPKYFLNSSPVRSTSLARLESSLPSIWKSSDTRDSCHRTVLFQLEIWHRRVNASDSLIGQEVEQRNLTCGEGAISGDRTKWMEGSLFSSLSNVSMKYRWRLIADQQKQMENPYLSDTNTTVKPVKKTECPQGFTGTDCKEAICSNRCHPTHGYCEKPDECQCRFGWQGLDCDQCLPMPGCVHGNCIKPFECR